MLLFNSGFLNFYLMSFVIQRSHPRHYIIFIIFYFYLFIFKDFIYLFMRDTEREGKTQAEGEAGSMQGARRGTRSRVSRIRPWAKGSTKLLSHPGCPSTGNFYIASAIWLQKAFICTFIGGLCQVAGEFCEGCPRSSCWSSASPWWVPLQGC